MDRAFVTSNTLTGSVVPAAVVTSGPVVFISFLVNCTGTIMIVFTPEIAHVLAFEVVRASMIIMIHLLSKSHVSVRQPVGVAAFEITRVTVCPIVDYTCLPPKLSLQIQYVFVFVFETTRRVRTIRGNMRLPSKLHIVYIQS